MSADAPATDAFGPLRNFLEQETLSHFISEHHKVGTGLLTVDLQPDGLDRILTNLLLLLPVQPLELLKKGESKVGDAMKVGSCCGFG
jgi:hypothetical protein